MVVRVCLYSNDSGSSFSVVKALRASICWHCSQHMKFHRYDLNLKCGIIVFFLMWLLLLFITSNFSKFFFFKLETVTHEILNGRGWVLQVIYLSWNKT